VPSPKALLDAHGITPKKSLGQNYLHDANILEQIVQHADIAPHTTVLEIGPGLGALSVPLAKAAAHLILVETDTRIRPILEDQLQDFVNVTVIWQDFMDVALKDLVSDAPYVVAANLPYYITSAILRKLLEAANRPQRIVVTVQREVAERIVAQPGNMSLLSVAVQFYGAAEIVMRLNPGVFWPKPDVASAVVRIDCYPSSELRIPAAQHADFFNLVRAGFGQKRKQLKNAIGKGTAYSNEQIIHAFEQAALDPRRRAETLSLDEWQQLYVAFREQ
jgi:16S rRNA (adenine1518-N6/adenine1519-N6)-dimethyltransferase